MDTNNVLGEVLEKGQAAIQKTVKSAGDSATGVVKQAAGQVTGSSDNQTEINVQPQDKQAASDKAQADEFVRDLYAPSRPQKRQDNVGNQPLELEDKEKIAQLRQKLHNEIYYQPLIQGEKSQEERPAEKVEHEKQKEMHDLQKEEAKKPPPLAVQRAQQSTEKFRGASG